MHFNAIGSCLVIVGIFSFCCQQMANKRVKFKIRKKNLVKEHTTKCNTKKPAHFPFRFEANVKYYRDEEYFIYKKKEKTNKRD